ncbi:MAG: methylated-DNA--[protein]-cysteine S-methyltransferase [Chloroflexota bacterium]|nr:methylated-DNA--[protein]-cysteine S-methyltransferase [Chloroflexota bacterium]
MSRPETRYTTVPSPIGDLLLVGDGFHLTGLYLPQHKGGPAIEEDWTRDEDWTSEDETFALAVSQLRAYFAGELKTFALPLAPRGTPFQRSVWQALAEIPYGSTATYGQLAARIGNPTAARAVGLATGRNPLSIVIPCHRAVGTGGALTGYAGGVERKRQLLALEGVPAGGAQSFAMSPLLLNSPAGASTHASGQ